MTNDLAKDFTNIIKNYTVDEYFIHINYLDGRSETINKTYHNIDMINEKMINQANEIISYLTSQNSIDKRNVEDFQKALTATTIALAATFTSELWIGNIDIRRVAPQFFASITIVPLITYLINRKNHQDDDNEVSKYKLLLDNYKEIDENHLKSFLYEGINKKDYISINTIDNYSYDEIKKIVDNLGKPRTKASR
jgi:hypothetical protein